MKFLKYCIVAFVALFSYTSYAQVAIIAHKSVPVSSISTSQLTDIYLLRTKTWSNGKAVIPVTLKADNETTKKVFGVVGKSSMELKKLWMKLQLTGEGQPPEGVGSEDEVLSKVASTPGAIGFVDADKVSSNVKVLFTIK